MKPELIFKLSAIIDKMEISEQIAGLDITTAEKGDNEAEERDKKALGAKLIMLFVSKVYKAKEEVYDLISYYKNISREEAENVDIIPVIKEILKIDGVQDFLA